MHVYQISFPYVKHLDKSTQEKKEERINPPFCFPLVPFCFFLLFFFLKKTTYSN